MEECHHQISTQFTNLRYRKDSYLLYINNQEVALANAYPLGLFKIIRFNVNTPILQCKIFLIFQQIVINNQKICRSIIKAKTTNKI